MVTKVHGDSGDQQHGGKRKAIEKTKEKKMMMQRRDKAGGTSWVVDDHLLVIQSCGFQALDKELYGMARCTESVLVIGQNFKEFEIWVRDAS